MTREERKEVIGKLRRMHKARGVYWDDDAGLGWLEALPGMTLAEFESAHAVLAPASPKLPTPPDYWTIVNRARAKQIDAEERAEREANRGELIPMPEDVRRQIEAIWADKKVEGDNDRD
jgi:hypothetical protein